VELDVNGLYVFEMTNLWILKGKLKLIDGIIDD
jgi:hypothetical protein